MGKARQHCLRCLLLQLVILGDVNDRNDMLTITKTKEPAHCCCWSKDGKYVLAAGDCGTVKLVEITEKKRAVRCTYECLVKRPTWQKLRVSMHILTPP
jgi:WD40 repeat protein